MNNPKISVIVPVYNGEKFMHRCIDNILAQTFTDFELIIVDDGSTDDTGAICDGHAGKDKRVRVFHKQNGGVSSARNLGLEMAVGDWIVFVDCDDTITDTYLEDLMQDGIPASSLVVASYSNIGRERHLDAGRYSRETMIQYVMDHNILALSGPCAKLYNREVINANCIKFPVGVHMGEDGIFITKYLNAVDHLVVVDKNDYWVNTVEGSLSSKYNEWESEWLGFETWRREVTRLVNRYDDIFADSEEIVWGSPIVDLFVRCMHCSYMLPNRSLSERVGMLKRIPEEAYISYAKYRRFSTRGRRDRLQYILISHKLYCLYVLVGLLMKNYLK